MRAAKRYTEEILEGISCPWCENGPATHVVRIEGESQPACETCAMELTAIGWEEVPMESPKRPAPVRNPVEEDFWGRINDETADRKAQGLPSEREIVAYYRKRAGFR